MAYRVKMIHNIMNHNVIHAREFMLEIFLEKVSEELRRAGYQVNTRPQIPGVQGLLYARTPARKQVGVAKIEDHFLFIDWDNTLFGRLELVKETYKRFSSEVNKGFKVPHAWRVQMPNLAVIAISRGAFPEEAVNFARSTNLGPWYGGETGQLMLVNLELQNLTAMQTFSINHRPRYGALPLAHAVDVIREVCDWAFMQV